MNVPSIYKPIEIKFCAVSEEYEPGKWRISRPYGYKGLFIWQRLNFAWMVFIGRYDVLNWR
jgi:hypothetical protein